MTRNKLVWKRNKIEGGWELKVNDEITISLDNMYGCWSVWLEANDEMTKIGDFYDHIADAKAKGLKVALAIIEY